MHLDDLDPFWERDDPAYRDYVGEPLTPALLERVERALGRTLPAAYVRLCERQNGGVPRRTCHPSPEPTNWADDHVALTGIYAIGEAAMYSLLGKFGRGFWEREWGYPPGQSSSRRGLRPAPG